MAQQTRPHPPSGSGAARPAAASTIRPPRIPMPADVAALVGELAEHVQNRSLLLDKYVFHKKWGLENFSANDAHRWSLLRVSDGGPTELARDGNRRSDRAGGRNVAPANADRLRQESAWAKRLSSTKAESEDAQKLRQAHSRNLVSLFRSAYGERASITVARLNSRLAINLADGLLQNAGIVLDRLFGLPYIPGSAVKGVCRHAGLEQIANASVEQRSELLPLFARVFGTADNDYSRKGELANYRKLVSGLPENLKGAITFLPAYPIDEARVVVDLTTVHYPEYYRTGDPRAQADEKPLPNPFPTVEAGSRFAFLLLLNGLDEDLSLLGRAETWLKEALTVRGLGAKTSAGYGWFEVDEAAKAALLNAAHQAEIEARAKAEAVSEAHVAAEQEARRQAALTPEHRDRKSVV